MDRACSNNPDDLNRDPAVQRAYRRCRKTGRLERVEEPSPPLVDQNTKGKRKHADPERIAGSSKRARVGAGATMFRELDEYMPAGAGKGKDIILPPVCAKV